MSNRCLYTCNWLTDKNKESSGNNRTGLTTECSNSSDTWRLLVQDKEYASYSVVSLSACRTVVAFGNLQGRLKLLHLGEGDILWGQPKTLGARGLGMVYAL